MKDYYKILGIERSATPEDIKKAYRRLASKHHPDKGGDKAQFQDVQEAYETLSDTAKRQAYDNPGVHINVGGGPGFNFDDIFQMFGTRFEHPNVRQNRQSRMTLWITLRDIAQGGKRIISIGTRHGSSNVEIEIPPGIEDGDTVRYPGVAPDKSDIVITYRVRPDPKWIRQGSSLMAEETLDFWQLILGTEVVVKSILDKELILTIPALTQPGTMFRIKGHGLTQRHDQLRGDMLIRVQSKLPEKIPQEIIDVIKQKTSQ